MRIPGLRLHVHRLVAVDRVHDRRQHEARRLGAREAAVAIERPLHRRAHPVAVAEIDVVAHPDFVAVVDYRRARHREQEAVHQLDQPRVTLEQRRKTAADAEVEPRPAVGGIGFPKIIALRVGHHLERQFVVVAQEDRPLTRIRNLRRLAQDVGDRKTVLLGDRHVHARHQREVERHVALVAGAEILLHVLRPLVGLGEQHATLGGPVEGGADAPDDRVRLREVLAVRSFALDQVRNGVEPESVHAEIEPEPHRPEHRREHARIVEVEIRLVRIEPMPEIRLGHRIEAPVRFFRVGEDDPRIGVAAVVVGPDIEPAPRRSRLGAARALEPGVLVGGMVDYKLRDHPKTARVRRGDEPAHVLHRAVFGMHGAVVGDVVAVVAPRRGIEGQKPDRGRPQLGDVVELRGQPGQVADAVVVRIEERLHVHLIDDRILVPERFGGQRPGRAAAPAHGACP